MNIGNILKVAEAIESQSVKGLGFNMSQMKFKKTLFESRPFDASGHACSTVACIAGWTTTIAGLKLPMSGEVKYHAAYANLAADYLDLSKGEAKALFYPDAVPHEKWSAITPKQAVRVLRNLAITGKVDWEAATKPNTPTEPSPLATASPTRAKRERV